MSVLSLSSLSVAMLEITCVNSFYHFSPCDRHASVAGSHHSGLGKGKKATVVELFEGRFANSLLTLETIASFAQ